MTVWQKLIEEDRYEEWLLLPLEEDGPVVGTIQDYLECLLTEVWQRGESFSGKHPFGDSGWEYDLYWPLVRGGAIKGTIDEEYGDVHIESTEEGHELVEMLIEHIFSRNVGGGYKKNGEYSHGGLK